MVISGPLNTEGWREGGRGEEGGRKEGEREGGREGMGGMDGEMREVRNTRGEGMFVPRSCRSK